MKNLKSIITEEKIKREKLVRRLLKEEALIDKRLKLIKALVVKYVTEYSAEAITKLVISKKLVTKDKLSTEQLYLDTLELIKDLLVCDI